MKNKKERNKVKSEKSDFYEKVIKRAFDKSLSLMGMLLFWPIYGIIALAIIIDDPGPVLFIQKRIGKDKHPFTLHKFRTMKMSAPHDVPTHQLENPERYITRVGKFLRKYSLDELPQIWDIFNGNMSVIGPRPALWNQDDLVAERDRYGANAVLPGLTGWAQINGRDELEVAEKARLDGEYARHLRQGGMKALFFDVKCFVGTIYSVMQSKGVVEGGTGELRRAGKMKAEGGGSEEAECHMVRDAEKAQAGLAGIAAEEAGFADYGHLKRFHIDTGGKNKKRVLVTGAGSYIGESFAAYAQANYPGNFTVDTVDMRGAAWRETDFSPYDAVFHVAGIAHADVGKVSEEEKKQYYAVNTDLAIEAAEKAKREGVRQFVFMSSMIIYGDSAPFGKEKVIDEHTLPAPANFYGDSKWQADRGVRRLADSDFHVAVLRPPMIYGKGSKGNYQTLAKLAKGLPAFPDVENRRSMLYVGNLCEFLCRLVLSGEGGVYFPQNGEHAKTAEMVKEIAAAAGKRIWVTKLLSPMVAVGSHVPGKVGRLAGKAFGNSVYNQELSRYEGLEYRKTGLAESLRETEGEDPSNALHAGRRGKRPAFPGRKAGAGACRPRPEPPAVLILANHDVVVYNFRLELVERLLAEGYEVHVSSPYGERIDDLVRLGVRYHAIAMERHGTNPGADLQIFLEYRRLIQKVRPMAILSYTVKPNVYGGLAAQMARIPFIANVTGLGVALNQGGMGGRLVLLLYRLGLRGARKVFFQNQSNRDFMLDRHALAGSCPNEVLPGSGVNLRTHNFEPYPDKSDRLVFTTIGRIMRDKGTDELLCAAGEVRKKYPSVVFRLIGFFDGDYEEKIRQAEKKGIVEYIEQQKDIHPWLKETHAVIHPSHHEGMSNVLLEAAATGRPVLASDIPGCREAFEEGVSGLGFPPQDAAGLAGAIERFIALPHEEKAAMGKAGREKMEREFNRDIIVGKYMNEIHQISAQSSERI